MSPVRDIRKNNAPRRHYSQTPTATVDSRCRVHVQEQWTRNTHIRQIRNGRMLRPVRREKPFHIMFTPRNRKYTRLI